MYRDELGSARLKLERVQQAVQEREDRISDELIEHLPVPLARAIQALREQLVEDTNSLEAIETQERLLKRYIKALDDALEQAPVLDRLFNGLSRSLPDRGAPSGTAFEFSDTFSTLLSNGRKDLHRIIASIDRRAQFIDKATNYALRDHAYLVEATFRARGCPIRLQVMGSVRYHLETFKEYRQGFYFCFRTLVRRSTPDMKLHIDTKKDRFKRLLKGVKDITVGSDLFDKLYAITGDADLIHRMLDAKLRAVIIGLTRSSTGFFLQIRNNVLTIEWEKARVEDSLIDQTLDILETIRHLPPIPLYKRLAK